MSETNQNQQNRAEKPRRPRRRSTGLRILSAFFKVLGTLVLIGLVTGAILACFATVYIRTIIMPQAGLKLTEFPVDLTSHMYYFDPESGERKELQTLHGDENRVWVSYDEIPRDLIDAAVAIEDKTFWEHKGVNWYRTAGAFVNMFLSMKDNFGGSTITQQLIKNVTTEDDATVKRKIIEIFRALEFDSNYSKETTMEWYLNYIFLGERCRGVYTASYTYFGKHVSELSLAECASLIGITNNPSRYDPYLSLVLYNEETGKDETNIERNKRRQEVILYEMLDQGWIEQEEYDQAMAEELVFVRGQNEDRPQTVFTWYEDQVIEDVIGDLMAEYDMSREAATQAVYNGGLEIETCFDPKVQAAVDAVYEDMENFPYISATGQQLQSAITIVDNATGDVVAMAGGVGEKEGSRLNNRATAAARQPGSSIKPIGVYAPAIELGLITPHTVLDDVPVNLDGRVWPRNHYSSYRGRMTVFEAVEDSSNAVAVRTLRDLVTPQASYDFMTGKLGFTTLVAARESDSGRIYSDIDVAPLSLGGLTDGVTTMEMAAAYAAFPRMGVYTEPRTYSRVYDSEGNVVLEKESRSSVVIKESTAFYISDLLKNVVNAGTGTRARISGMTVAGKTGTTTNEYDLYFAGYTPYYTAAVWTGYDQNEPIRYSNGAPATVVWQKVMERVHEGLEGRDFDLPTEGVVTRQYCRDSGLLPSDYCPNDARGSRVSSGTFITGDAPTQYCTMHVPVFLCKDDPILDEWGEPSGMYHIAGEFCPAESRLSVAVIDYEQPFEGVEYTTNDEFVTQSYLDGLGTCHIHTEPPAPEPDPEQPEDSIWPWDTIGGTENGDGTDAGEEDDGWRWPWENLNTPAPSPSPEAPLDWNYVPANR